MSQPILNPALVVKFAELSSATIKRALDETNVHRAAQKQAADLRPATLEFMVTNGLIDADQKTAADAMLASHASTLNLLKTAGEKIVELKKELAAKTAELGAPAEKQAGDEGAAPGSYNSLDDPFVGRRTSEKKASDQAILKVLEAPGR